MARYQPLWQQAGSYPAGLDRQALSNVWPLGGSTPSGVCSLVNNTMQVSVAPSSAVVPLVAGQGAALCIWDAAEIVTLAAAPASGQARWDLIVAQVRDNQVDAGPNNDFIITNVTGVAGGQGPGQSVPPPAPANAYVLATVGLTGGTANLNTAVLLEKRSSLLMPLRLDEQIVTGNAGQYQHPGRRRHPG